MDVVQISESIDQEKVKTAVDGLRSAVLVEPATNFERGLKSLGELVEMPGVLVAICEGILDRRIWETVARATLQIRSRGEGSEPRARDVVDAEVARLKSRSNAPTIDLVAEAKKRLAEFASIAPEVNDPLRALTLHTLSGAWGVFEVLAKDVWVAAVNEHPMDLGHTVITNAPEKVAVEGLNARSIQVGLLAQYGFDVSKSLGTLLAGKYDFTSRDGIALAYRTAFRKGSRWDAIRSNTQLAQLEALRHLVVHRGGVVDAQYRARVSTDCAMNTPVAIDEKTAAEFFSATVDVGCLLLAEVDAELSNLGSRARSEK